MTSESGIKFRIDATEGSTRYLNVEIIIEPPFTKNTLTLNFPRWVPGSYFIREPIQYVSDINCLQNQKSLNFKRKGVDSLSIKLNDKKQPVSLNYKILGKELSCRSTHIDSSHLHMMPPFTFFLPSSGIELSRIEYCHYIELHANDNWIPATQLELIKSESSKGICGNSGISHTFKANNRDELLDGVIEINSNENINFEVDGISHVLKLWDSGQYSFDSKMVDRFIVDMKKVISEHHALFGIPNWGGYVTILQLTEKSRGGLEHLNSQTSMLPRLCLIEGHVEQYRDLVSLFSHEYLHRWNVKRLRPKNFHDYDLQKEVHSNLLWWFEGCTSWLGDMLCVRSGAWSEEDWRKDLERKLGRHLNRNGMTHESLAESSHDAWIHLYRSHSFSRETQISYYLEGELAIFCIDAELRRRSNGLHGVCDLMAKLCEKYALGYEGVKDLGVDYNDIRKELVNMKGGRNLGKYLDSLVYERKAPDFVKALDYYGLSLTSSFSKDAKPASAWLGLNLSTNNGRIIATSHIAESPLRNLIMPGDEIISINKIRLKDVQSTKSILSKLDPNDVEICYVHEGIVKTKKVTLIPERVLKGKLEGIGNKKWKNYISSRSN